MCFLSRAAQPGTAGAPEGRESGLRAHRENARRGSAGGHDVRADREPAAACRAKKRRPGSKPPGAKWRRRSARRQRGLSRAKTPARSWTRRGRSRFPSSTKRDYWQCWETDEESRGVIAYAGGHGAGMQAQTTTGMRWWIATSTRLISVSIRAPGLRRGFTSTTRSWRIFRGPRSISRLPCCINMSARCKLSRRSADGGTGGGPRDGAGHDPVGAAGSGNDPRVGDESR